MNVVQMFILVIFHTDKEKSLKLWLGGGVDREKEIEVYRQLFAVI